MLLICALYQCFCCCDDDDDSRRAFSIVLWNDFGSGIGVSLLLGAGRPGVGVPERSCPPSTGFCRCLAFIIDSVIFLDMRPKLAFIEAARGGIINVVGLPGVPGLA